MAENSVAFPGVIFCFPYIISGCCLWVDPANLSEHVFKNDSPTYSKLTKGSCMSKMNELFFKMLTIYQYMDGLGHGLLSFLTSCLTIIVAG